MGYRVRVRRSTMMRVAGRLATLSLLAASPAGADPARAQAEARLLSANPDSPTSAFFWRDELHGKLGAPIPLLGERTGFSLQLPALIELHNARPSLVPYQFWRARVSLEAIHRRVLDGGRFVLGTSILAEHESDHVSGPPGHFLNRNGVAFRLDFTWMFGDDALTASSIARMHLRTCTLVPILCDRGGGREGSAAFEQTAEVVFDGGWGNRCAGRPRYFLSAMGSLLPAHRLAGEEKRAVAEVGLSVRRPEHGLLQVYFTGLAGNEIGYLRHLTDTQVGLGVRWAP